MRAMQLASVSSCACTSPLEAFQLQMLFMMRTTDDLGMPVPDFVDRLSFGQVTTS